MQKYNFGFYDFITNSKHYIFIIFEKIFIIFLMYVMINDSTKVLLSVYRINQINNSKIFVNQDKTKDKKIQSLYEDCKTIEKANKINNYINKNFMNFSFWEYETENKVGEIPIIQANTNPYFFELFNIKVIQGRNFNKDDEINAKSIKPIIVGYNLKNKYKLKRIYTDVDLDTGKKFSFQVIGVLPKNTTYPSLSVLGEKYFLDNTYLKLVDIKSLKDFANIDMALGSKIIFSESDKAIKKIELLSKDYKLFDMNFVKVETSVADYLSDFFSNLLLLLLVTLILLALLFFLSLNKLSMIIKNNKRNYLIQVCCGATIKDLFILFMAQFILIDLIALIPTLLFCFFNYGNYFIIIFILAINFIINFLIVHKTFHKFTFESITELIRKG